MCDFPLAKYGVPRVYGKYEQSPATIRLRGSDLGVMGRRSPHRMVDRWETEPDRQRSSLPMGRAVARAVRRAMGAGP